MRGSFNPIALFKRGWPFNPLQSFGVFLVVVLSGVFLDELLINQLSEDFLWKITFLSTLTTELGDATLYYLISIGLWLLSVLWQTWRRRSGAFTAKASAFFQSQVEHPRHDLLAKLDEWSISARAWAGKFFLALISAAVLVHALKMMVGRLRPYASAGSIGKFDPSIFNPFTLHPDYHSFPSGHSQVVFCVGVAFSSFLPQQKRWLHVLIFFFCAWVAFTRVPTHNHYLTDVLVGSLIGFVVTRAYFRPVF